MVTRAPPLDIAFVFIDTAPTEIYTLSLHDALPICPMVISGLRHVRPSISRLQSARTRSKPTWSVGAGCHVRSRSEEHTSELQSRLHLVCRLLLEKKKRAHCRLRWRQS